MADAMMQHDKGNFSFAVKIVHVLIGAVKHVTK